MQIQINGKQEQVESDTTIKSLLEKKEINPNVVACELNLKIIKRSQLSDVLLKEGDELEVIQMIGGG